MEELGHERWLQDDFFLTFGAFLFISFIDPRYEGFLYVFFKNYVVLGIKLGCVCRC